MLKDLSARLKRYERRLGRKYGRDISSPRARRRALMHYNFIDHGILRQVWSNLVEIAPGVWRSNHPPQHRIRRYRRMGIKAILNLRGRKQQSHYLFEREACRAAGIKLVDRRLSARELAQPKDLLRLLSTFETIERPFLMHCKSGADRAGLAAALYLMHIENVPVSVAKKQLSLRYAHVRSFRTGILDFMLDRYEADTRDQPMPIAEWIRTRYDPVALTAAFERERGRG